MKRLSLTFVFICCELFSFAQTEAIKFKADLLNNKVEYKELIGKELKSTFISKDFSRLFTHADNSIVYGFIGDNYLRIRIKLITVTKDAKSPDVYHVYGKSMVKTNVDEFNGTITITNIRQLKNMSYGVDDEYKGKGLKGEYIVLADYSFLENKAQPHSGQFKGVCESDFYLDKNNKVNYDDIDLGSSDRFKNNQFAGQWASYDNRLIQRCNWGDFRIPNSDHFDIGAGDFSPAGYGGKYLQNGWQTLNDEKIENAKWWQWPLSD